MIGHAMAGAASFTIYTRTKEFFRDHHLLDHRKLLGCAAIGGIGGAMAGSLISFGSAREFLAVRCKSFHFFLILGNDDQLSNSSRYHTIPGPPRRCMPSTADDAFAGRFGGSWNIRLRRRKESSW